ncbi:MAG: glycoside hydrolase family 13 protein [Clostridia bacterium]|nr:glycoside hydrolase family 13 protein [Clostridia bacterium]
MHYIPYNSRLQFHKNKFGAIPSDCTVCLRVILPREMRCSAVRLCVKKDGEDEVKYAFDWDCMEGLGEEWWRIDFTPHSPGLYWYHFEYDIPFGSGKIYHRGNGIGALCAEGKDWQLTVYDKDFTTPDRFKGGIIYQIFPDRFNKAEIEYKDVPEDREIRTDWGALPRWEPNKNGKVTNSDYFCGNLKGIEEKLDYIASLGVTCIYLNPIFEAHSNHRYNTADYTKIDPLLGTEEDFADLCKAANKKGIDIILDGVFNHTGSDSVYFNLNNRYNSVGAYQSKESPYYSWYSFRKWPEIYDSWWDFDTLPDTNETDEGFRSFLFSDSGVIKKWLRLGASGWRLDVADELPDSFLDELCTCVKEEKPDALILGEVWEDASNKCAYSKRRRYLLGGQLDSVMNYPFADAIMYFMRTGIANGFTEKILTILENYPPQCVALLMNHIGTHDTVRAITAMVGESTSGKDRRWQANQTLTEEQKEIGIKMMKTAAAIQFTLPGIPSIYYGDEVGLEGCRDPFNRGCFPWGSENEELLDWYRRLGKIRRSSPALSYGSFVPVSEAAGCIAFAREGANSKLLTIANRNVHPITYYLPEAWHGARLLLGGTDIKYTSVEIPANGAVILRK